MGSHGRGSAIYRGKVSRESMLNLFHNHNKVADSWKGFFIDSFWWQGNVMAKNRNSGTKLPEFES